MSRILTSLRNGYGDRVVLVAAVGDAIIIALAIALVACLTL